MSPVGARVERNQQYLLGRCPSYRSRLLCRSIGPRQICAVLQSSPVRRGRRIVLLPMNRIFSQASRTDVMSIDGPHQPAMRLPAPQFAKPLQQIVPLVPPGGVCNLGSAAARQEQSSGHISLMIGKYDERLRKFFQVLMRQEGINR
jgi:hypothetical protein